MAKQLQKSTETPSLELRGNMPGISKSVHVPQACQNISNVPNVTRRLLHTSEVQKGS